MVILKKWHPISLYQCSKQELQFVEVCEVDYCFNSMCTGINISMINAKRWTKHEQLRAFVGKWYPMILC